MTVRELPVLSQPDAAACCAPLAAPTLTDAEAETTARLFKALADPTRLTMLATLTANPEPVCACDLGTGIDLGQPTVSHHLKVLREAGLVDSERRGLWAYYYVTPDSLKELSAWLS